MSSLTQSEGSLRKMKDAIYLDYAATSPVLPEVLEEMLPFFTQCYGNPSGVYATSREARQAVEKARRQVADAIGAEPGEIYFTSGGSESDNMAILGIPDIRGNSYGHIITTQIEHHAVLNACRQLQKEGVQVTYLRPDRDGIISPEDAEKAIRAAFPSGKNEAGRPAALISVMTANNEIGTIEPIQDIGTIARRYGITMHTDAVQAIGAIPVDVNEMSVDMMSISAHKFYGPKGIGAMYIRKGTRISSLIFGGKQERGLRAGTENTAGIVGLGKAIEIAVRDMAVNAQKNKLLQDRMIRKTLDTIRGSSVNGSMEHRLNNNCHFSFTGIDGEALLLRLDLAGIAASGGSACTSGSREPSHVLQAIGLDPERTEGSIRFSIGRETTAEEIDQAVSITGAIVEDLRKLVL